MYIKRDIHRKSYKNEYIDRQKKVDKYVERC